MKDALPEFYDYPQQLIDDLWDNALVVFDTNVLLDLYVTATDMTKMWYKLFEALKKDDRLWMPYQVALEYQKNRGRIINNREASLSNIENTIKKAYKSIRMAADKAPFLDMNLDSCSAEYTSLLDGIKEKERYWKKPGKKITYENDRIRDALDAIFSAELIGEKYSKAQLSEIYDEGADRYPRFIPPGFEDSSKKISPNNCDFDSPSLYGDFVIWKELLRYGRENNRSIIFVSNDRKDDWVWAESGKKESLQSTHPYLRMEFHTETKQHLFACSSTECLRNFENRYAIKPTEEYFEKTETLLERTSEEKRLLNLALLDKFTISQKQLMDEFSKPSLDTLMSEMRTDQQCLSSFMAQTRPAQNLQDFLNKFNGTAISSQKVKDTTFSNGKNLGH
ncbi:MAG: DUF4935 domain-containing protein [Coriobacteriia bacterium]|nr:DUF4935 domain-containing protein [Coriobacteriia bacterium]